MVSNLNRLSKKSNYTADIILKPSDSAIYNFLKSLHKIDGDYVVNRRKGIATYRESN